MKLRRSSLILLAVLGVASGGGDLELEAGLVAAPARNCVEPADYLEAEGDFDLVAMQPYLHFLAAEHPTLPYPLRTIDCNSDGDLELFVPVSPEASPRGGVRPARMVFDRACSDGLPVSVSFTFMQGGVEAIWRAYDADGVLVDEETSGVSGTNQVVTLAHEGGIAEVEIVGIRICIDAICWRCGDVRTPPAPRDCVGAGDAYEEGGLADEVIIPPVRVTPAVTPAGVEWSLIVSDADGDGALDVIVPQSRPEDMPRAEVYFPVGCSPESPHPTTVSIRFHSDSPSRWLAYAVDGSFVDTVFLPASPAEQLVSLSHAGGIYRVEIVGHRLSLFEFCWDCERAEEKPRFVRGDTDGNLTVDLTDGVKLLNFLFLGGEEPGCRDAADSDDNGLLGLADATVTFNYLFLGGPAPPGSDGCYPDPTQDRLGCEAPPRCGE